MSSQQVWAQATSYLHQRWLLWAVGSSRLWTFNILDVSLTDHDPALDTHTFFLYFLRPSMVISVFDIANNTLLYSHCHIFFV
jgi:hypothetical protein